MSPEGTGRIGSAPARGKRASGKTAGAPDAARGAPWTPRQPCAAAGRRRDRAAAGSHGLDVEVGRRRPAGGGSGRRPEHGVGRRPQAAARGAPGASRKSGAPGELEAERRSRPAYPAQGGPWACTRAGLPARAGPVSMFLPAGRRCRPRGPPRSRSRRRCGAPPSSARSAPRALRFGCMPRPVGSGGKARGEHGGSRRRPREAASGADGSLQETGRSMEPA
jgi:hypothetical protein